jgi:NitT/TauT family transport system permease protein
VSRTRHLLDQIWPRVAIIVAILIVWWAIAAVAGSSVLPTPLSVWRSIVANLGGPTGLAVGAERSVVRLAVGMVAAVAIGTLIGLSMAASQPVQRSVGTLMIGLLALPSIAWLPLAIHWFGFTTKAILYVVVIGAVPAIAVATAASLRQVPPVLVRAARTMGARGWTLYRRVVLPAAVPGYWAGLQQAWGIAWRALMAGEIIVTGARGLGRLLDRAGAFNTPLLIATMIVIMIVGVGIEMLFTVVDRRIRTRRGLVVGSIGAN